MQNLDLSKISLRMLALPITVVIFLVILVILVKRLADSLKLSTQNTGRINQYLAAVPADKIGIVNAVYLNTKKDLALALILCLVGGTFGIQRIYLGRRRSAVLMLLFFWTGVPSVISLFDMVAMPRLVSEFNLTVVRSLYDQIAAPNLKQE